jgi:hypothetical protein
MLDLQILGLGGDFTHEDNYPAQFLVGDTNEPTPGVLVGCHPQTRDALDIVKMSLADVKRIFVLNLLDAQVGGLEEVAIATYYQGAPKRTLYVPEAIVDDLWEKLRRPLEAVASARHKRVTLDVYFNVVSLSEENSVAYEGDLELRPFRVPSFPGLHSFGLFVNNTAGPNLAILPYGTFTSSNLQSVLKLVGKGSLILGINDGIPARADLAVLAGMTEETESKIILCGGVTTGNVTRRVNRGDRIVL